MSRILGIDSGPTMSAYCELIDGKIGPHNWLESDRLLMALRAGFADGATTVIEFPQAQDRPLGPLLLNTIRWASRYVECLDNRATPYVESDEREDCLWLTGNPSGTNAAILAALKKHFGDNKQVPCRACDGAGRVISPKGLERNCKICHGKRYRIEHGPLWRFTEHERSALAAALCYHQRHDHRAAS